MNIFSDPETRFLAFLGVNSIFYGVFKGESTLLGSFFGENIPFLGVFGAKQHFAHDQLFFHTVPWSL